MALSTKFRVELSATQTPTVDLGPASRSGTVTLALTLADGVGANQANLMWFDSNTLAASTNVDLDLAAGLTDSFGNTLTFVKVKAIAVKAAAGNTNNVLVGGAASNQFASFFGDVSDKLVVQPGGAFGIATPGLNGYGVTAGTGDLLRIANSGAGTSVGYEIAIVGTAS